MTTQTMLTQTPAPALTPAPASDVLGTPAPDAAAEVFAERLTAAALGGMEMAAVHLGTRLGWYQALHHNGALTSSELALLTGTAERYAREWLEHQAASGYLGTTDEGDGRERRYRLHPGAAEALVDIDSPFHVAPLSGFLAAAGRVTDQLVDAYRTGGGVSWAELGADARQAQSAFNRPLFLHQLAQEIVPALPELAEHLRSGGRVADIGCGEGWSGIGLAAAFPGITVDGYDIDRASVTAAERHAAAADTADRVRFAHVDAASLDPEVTGRYDVVTAFECVHDMPDPVAVLSAMRRLVVPGGYVLVMDERAEDAFAAPAGPVERLLYGFSLLCCLPDGLSHPDGIGTGTVMRPSTLAAYAAAGGFASVEVLPVDHEMFRFYRLHQ